MSPDDVRATVLAVVHCIDARKWKELPELFAATVAVDYTSLFGGAASQTKASELVCGLAHRAGGRHHPAPARPHRRAHHA
jgi:hypothetical protein